MDAPVATVVWQSERPPSEDARRALEAFARARGVTLRAPVDAGAPALEHAPEDARAIEGALAAAREATAQLDAEACERWLARAEGRLRAHPELPQSAFLMAEVQRGWAARYARLAPKDEGRAERARLAADALDGGRAAGVGELAGPPPPLAEVTLAFDEGAVVRVDGRALGPGATRLAAGEHHVTAARGGVVRFASWVSIAAGATLRLPGLDAPACSVEDLARGRASVASVRCEAWALATEGERPGTARVAWCARGTCGASTLWSPWRGSWPPLEENRARGLRIPAWLVWTGVGAVAVGAGLAILFASGVFDAAPHTTRFVQGPTRVE